MQATVELVQLEGLVDFLRKGKQDYYEESNNIYYKKGVEFAIKAIREKQITYEMFIWLNGAFGPDGEYTEHSFEVLELEMLENNCSDIFLQLLDFVGDIEFEDHEPPMNSLAEGFINVILVAWAELEWVV